MALVINEIERAGRGSGPWAIPPRRAFARSSAYDVLRRSLSRYVARQTAGGRSFLIAGHRGAGKTAIVEQVVNDMKWDAIEAVAAGALSLHAPRRPFLVKLHGPSLVGQEPDSSAPAPELDPKDPQTVTSPAHRALIQIALGLYRAFAQEVGAGFELHARSDGPVRDQAEFAGQLLLELDQAPDPSVLRFYWKRLGRLKAGVLWPDPPLGKLTSPDQGIREVIALASAAQAFRVCAGKSSETEEQSRSAERQRERHSQRGLDFKQAANKIGAVLFGLGAGALAQANAEGMAKVLAWAAGAGMLSAFSLSWADSRTQKHTQGKTYTFIRDFSVATLDRELPLAIDRIKAAGLVPVFVVDELDKVPNSALRISELLKQLKHIVTDFGFFSFLTDRDLPHTLAPNELFFIARDAGPGRYFRQYLSHMTMAEWTQLAFASVIGPVPSWTMIAGLAALGAGREILANLLQDPAAYSPVSQGNLVLTEAQIEVLLERPDQQPPGVLVLCNSRSAVANWQVEGDQFGMVVRSQHYQIFSHTLDYLTRLGAFRWLAIEDSQALRQLEPSTGLATLDTVRFTTSSRGVVAVRPGEQEASGLRSFADLTRELVLRAPRAAVST